MPHRFTPLVAVAIAAMVAPAWADDKDEKAEPAGTSAASMFEQLDTNKDGQLTEDEVPDEHQRLFDRLVRTADKDSDGKLTSGEFSAGLDGDSDKPDRPEGPDGPRGPRDREGAPGGRPSPDQIFTRLDANADGKITLDEVPDERREMFERMFKRGDADGDGALSKEELTAVFAKFPPRPDGSAGDKRPKGRPEGRPEPKQLFSRLDANGDGKVTLDEVPEQARPRIEKLLKRADKDGDEAISLEEFSAMKPPGKPGKGKPGKGKPEAGSEGRPNKPKRPEGAAGRPPGARPGPPMGLFGSLDADHDGQLSSDEISAAAEVIRTLDTDGDGSVSIREIIAAGPDRKKTD